MATLAGRAYIDVAYDPKSITKLRAETAAQGKHVTNSFGDAGRRAGKLLAVGVGVGAVATAYGLTKAVQSAADFQKQLNILQAVSGATASQMKKIQAEAIALGKDMKLPATSASDAANAMTELAKGGLSVRDSMKAARGALELAVAGQTDVGTAASVTATSLNQFALNGSKATHVADLLANAANASAGDVVDFAEGLKYAGTSAHAAGQSIDLTVAALAEMSNKGLAGSVAGSSLAQALRSLQAPSKAAAAEIKQYGLNIYDATGKMKPLDQIANIFAGHLGDLTQKQQNATLATIFGSRAVQAARVVFLGGGKELDKYQTKVSKVGGAQRLAAAQMKGFSGAIQGFTSNIETLGIQIGLVLLPPLTKAIGYLNDFATLIGKVAAAPSVSIAFKIAWKGVGKLYNSLHAALFGEVTSLGTQGLKAGAAHGIQLPVQVDKKGLVPQLAAAIGGAVGGVDWTKIGTTIAKALSNGIHFTVEQAGAFISTFTTAILAHSNEIADAGAKITAELIANLLDPAFWLKNWKTALAIGLSVLPVGDLLGIGGKIGLKLGEGLTGTFLRIAAHLPGFLQRAIGAAVRIGEGLFAKLGDRAFAELQRGISKAPGLVQRFIGAAIKIGQDLFGRIASFISSKLGSAIETIGKKIQSSLIGRTLLWLAKFGLIKTAIDAITSAFGYVIQKIKDAISWIGKFLSPVNALLGFLHLPKVSLGSGGQVPSRGAHPHHASGGLVPATPGGTLMVDRQGRPKALISEAGADEYVLSTDSKHRRRTMGLIGELLHRLGVHHGAGGIVPRYGLGGVLSSAGGAVGGALGGIVGAGKKLFGVLTDPIGWLKSHLPAAPTGPGVFGKLFSGIAGYLKNKVIGWIESHLPFGGGGSGPHGTAATGANQRLGYQMMLAAGFPASQWGALQALWNRESGWNQFAKNASSGAYGIPQSLPASKMASAGADWLTNPATQIRWGLGYIRGRYGSPAGAWAHEGQYGWYGQGGVVPGPFGQPQRAIVHGGELVLNKQQQLALLHGGMGGGDVYVYIGNEAIDPHLVRVVRSENQQTARRVKAGRRSTA